KVSLGSGQTAIIRFRELEDFEPEQLFKKVDTFSSLLDLRKRLHDPASFNSAKQEIQNWGRPAAEQASAIAPAAIPGNLLDQIQQDFDLLANVTQIAAKAGVSFIAAAHSKLVGCSTWMESPSPSDWELDRTTAQLWQQIRRMPNANHLGLATPRFILRMPHGDA